MEFGTVSGAARQLTLAAAGAGMMLLGGAGFAEAVPQTHSFAVTGAGLTDTFGFNQFNPSLGTLTGVSISTTGYGVSHFAYAEVLGAEFGVSITASVSGDFLVSGPNGTLLSATASASATCSPINPTSASSCFQPDFGSHSPNDLSIAVTYTSPLDLAAFIGTGTVDLTVAIQNYLSTIIHTPGSLPPLGNSSGSTTVLSYSPEIALDYTYDAPPPPETTETPEPGSLALLGTALAGMLWRRRK